MTRINEREIEERLKTAIEKTAPNDFSGVLSRVSDEKGSPIMTKKKNHRKFISGAMATCLALAILGGEEHITRRHMPIRR